jgi:hypothetical protein
MNKPMAEKYWEENRKFRKFHGTKRENKIRKKKIQDVIKNSVLVEILKKLIHWCKTNGDMRMREVNQFMVQKHFKMEGTPTLQDLIRKNDFPISLDLKEAYNHVSVHSTFQNLLGIQYMGTTYTYRGMPFHLNDAQQLFTQIMKKCVMVIRQIWRIRCVVYLNDLLLPHPDKNHSLFLILFISLWNKRSCFMLITSFLNTLCFFFYIADTLKFTINIIYKFTASGYYYHFIIFIFIIIGNDFSTIMV